MLECDEGCLLRVFGGSDSVVLAWYGDAKRAWQPDAGRECTQEVKSLLRPTNTMTACNSVLGDPCVKIPKKLFVIVDAAAQEWDLYCAGVVVWIYRFHGSM